MVSKEKHESGQDPPPGAQPPVAGSGHGRIVAVPDGSPCPDAGQLNCLEQSFRVWAAASSRADVRQSRRRILLIFLLIRYTGAKLNEVLALDPFEDLDPGHQSVFFRGAGTDGKTVQREVQISASLCREIQSALIDPAFRNSLQRLFAVDPAFVRRKFYERARSCGLPARLAGPEMIRKARAVELMQSNMPLPAVQMLLGHSTPNLTSAYVSFSEDEIRQTTRFFMERESARRTSARNAFFGRIETIREGGIQALVELTTLSGQSIRTVITTDSLHRLGLKKGMLVSAEVKAPWVMVGKGQEPACSAENRFRGTVARVTRGEINTEYVVRLADGTELCALITAEGSRRLNVREGEGVWAFFNCFSVVLHID